MHIINYLNMRRLLSALYGGVVVGVTACANEHIDRHHELVERLSGMPFHYRVSGYSSLTVSGRVLEPYGVNSVTEVWRSGVRRKEIRRSFRSGAPDSFEQSLSSSEGVGSQSGNVTISSRDAALARVLKGWDPERPPPLPIEFGRDAAVFGRISGQILPTDVLRRDLQFDAWVMLWEVFPEVTLADAAVDSEFQELPSPGPGLVRLQLTGSKNPKLAAVVGALVDLDVERSHAVRRIENSDELAKMTREVKEFRECLPGLWIPVVTEFSRTLNSGQASSTGRTETEEVTFGVSLDEADLVVEFPEGCKVYEQPSNMIHLWGPDGRPSATYSSQSEFMEAVYARAREYQSRHRPQGHPPAQGRPEGSLTLLIVNAVLIGLLVLFTVLRRRLARAGGPPPEAP